MSDSMVCRTKGCSKRVAIDYHHTKKRGWEVDTIHSRCPDCLNEFRKKREANRIQRAKDFKARMDALDNKPT